LQQKQRSKAERVTSRLFLALLWLTHWLPLPLLAALGRTVGRALHFFAKSRRLVALRNVELCFPEQSLEQRQALVREHFQWLGCSIIERGLLWYAPVERLKRLIHVEGQVTLAEHSPRPVMWLVPHFMGLDVAGAATQLFQKQQVGSIYQEQSDAVMDAAIRAGRLRFKQGEVFARSDSAKPLIRAIKSGYAFFNLPDMDFGARDAAFVPFFGVPAATLLAPSRMARALGMVVQPVVAQMLPGGQGYRVRFLEPWTAFPTADAMADTAAMNRWIEAEIRANPAQYLWVHKRFKTRPEGEASLY
jgi:Kdo2-lipid IVA lauroyltransferase/acyltransferase